MTESVDWRQKYRDSLVESESEEKRWRQVEQALRRLVGRLCAAGMGVDPKLDDELVALAAANRRNAAAEELERLAASLTTAVVAVDAVSPVPTITWADAAPAPRWDATCTALAAVFKHLKAGVKDSSASPGATIEGLLKQVQSAKTDAELAPVAKAAADLVAAQTELLARERAQAANVLTEVTRSVEEMASYLRDSGSANQARFADRTQVDETMILQVRELSVQIQNASELGALQASVTAQLTALGRQVADCRAREQAHYRDYAANTERMRVRITELEAEMQQMRAAAERPAPGAHLDALTRLANRRSFDERLTMELAQRSQSERPATLLLWDVDDFSAINQNYGHRAGDRVLQSIAGCLKANLRSEDFLARIGGEEFIMVLAGAAIGAATQSGNDLRLAVEALRLHFRGTPVRVTISCGLTELRPDDTAGAAFERVDAALTRAKQAGKNLCIAA